jgi:hypothetical protein
VLGQQRRGWRTPRALGAAVVAAGLALGGLVVPGMPGVSGVAHADSTLSERVDHTYQANGRVAAILPVGNTLYLAGSFTSLRPYGDPAGTGEVARSYLAAIDRDTGQLLPWNPGANKEAYALAASPDGSVIYVGGLFSAVAGQSRAKAAAVTAATGALTSWAPVLDNKVLAIAATTNEVYLGGTFTSVNGQARAGLAAVSPAGVLSAGWAPTPDDRVLALSLSADGGTVYAGGEFDSINGDTLQKHLVALSSTTGAVQPWAYHPGYPVYTMTIDDGRLYAGGNGSGGHAGAFVLPAGSRLWEVQTDGGAQGIAVLGDTVYVGGHFDNFCSDETVGGTTAFECPEVLAVRHKILALDKDTGDLDDWDPGADSPLGVYAIATSGGRLEIGGDFEHTGEGAAQQGFAQYSVSGTAVVPTGDAFTPVTPTRILDTRSGLGEAGGPARLGAGRSLTLHASAVAGVPLGIDAVVLNVTAVSPTVNTFVTAYPADLPAPPVVSNVNAAAGQIVPGLVTVKVDAAGRLDLYNAFGSVDLVADVAGYYAATAADTYTPLTPTRVLDTRIGLGAPTAPLGAGGTTDLQVTGVDGIPSDAVAVALNVTATNPTAATFVQAYPTPAGGAAAPTVSNLNVVAGRTVANAVTVEIGAGGKVRLGNAFGSVDLVADVAGYFSASAAGSRFTPLSPTRLLDSRSALGQATGQTGAAGPGGLIDLQVTGLDGVPVDATAAVLNVTAVAPTSATYLQAFPTPDSGLAFPTVSTVNPAAGAIVANSAAVAIGAGGKVRLRNHSGLVNVVADLAGYYASVAGVDHGIAPAAPSVAGVTLAVSASPLAPARGGSVSVVVATLPGAAVSATVGSGAGAATQTGIADGSGAATLTFAVPATAPVGVAVAVVVSATSTVLGAAAFAGASYVPAA